MLLLLLKAKALSVYICTIHAQHMQYFYWIYFQHATLYMTKYTHNCVLDGRKNVTKLFAQHSLANFLLPLRILRKIPNKLSRRMCALCERVLRMYLFAEIPVICKNECNLSTPFLLYTIRYIHIYIYIYKYMLRSQCLLHVTNLYLL